MLLELKLAKGVVRGGMAGMSIHAVKSVAVYESTVDIAVDPSAVEVRP